ncbi:hypothetical protein PROVRUST_06747 [Providencia rustigianii DSM 4541]|uniref:Uncharacterized protein n=1 Tax=Providencia rustigianii DSM 4541 TaxID=500637 RepID=D1P377_9GAMM|nr:hypothetical protein PROVRUST_06747 [Providencia rustigianii DSM 4541]
MKNLSRRDNNGNKSHLNIFFIIDHFVVCNMKIRQGNYNWLMDFS